MKAMEGKRARSVTLALLVAIVLGACTGLPGAPGGQSKPSGTPAAAKPEVAPISVSTSPVVRDLLSPTLSYAGNVQARTQVSLVPKISARLEKLNVDIGDEVKSGEVIAELDHAQLDAQVQQADASVGAAQARLDQAQASAKQEDIDAAQAVVDQAAARLEQARAGGRPEEVASARAAALQAQGRANQVAAGARPEEAAALQAGIDQAEAQQDQLRAQLTVAQTSLAEARYRLDQARSGQGGPGVRPEDIAAAQATFETARVRLQQLLNPRPEDIRSAELQVDRSRSDLDAAEAARDNCGKVSTTNKTSSTSKSTQKTQLGTSESTTKSENTSTSKQSCPESQKDQLDAQIESARIAVSSAENNLQRVRFPSPFDVQAAQQSVAQAEATLQKARYGGTSDIASLELRLASAQGDVDRLQASVDQMTAQVAQSQSRLDVAVIPNPYEVQQAAEAASQARANLARIANADPYAVAAAQASFEQSQAQLQSRLRPFTEQDIRVAASGVDQAVASLEIARVQAAEAVIRAPFDAVVSQKLLSPGAMASPQTPILGLVSRDVEIMVQVEEARLGQVQRGQPAELSVSAYPAQTFPAVVAAIAPSADPRSRTFAVRVVPREQDGRLRDGMFAQVNIAGVGQQTLLVPNASVVTRAGRSQVFAVVGDRAQAREVRLGESDGRRTAVLDGRVAVGDEVVVTSPEALTDGAPVTVDQRNVQPPARPAVQPVPGGSQAPTDGRPTQPGGQSSGEGR